MRKKMDKEIKKIINENKHEQKDLKSLLRKDIKNDKLIAKAKNKLKKK